MFSCISEALHWKLPIDSVHYEESEASEPINNFCVAVLFPNSPICAINYLVEVGIYTAICRKSHHPTLVHTLYQIASKVLRACAIYCYALRMYNSPLTKSEAQDTTRSMTTTRELDVRKFPTLTVVILSLCMTLNIYTLVNLFPYVGVMVKKLLALETTNELGEMSVAI